ncbi:hypothetical protein V502_11537 [Pseudogymnoascus sp. VKM F-4520 (FW-2644)]|nr:hypothetical protein V502_11537 [Pseudogymnoascus sp. VKM F-4520 (FW-2644)]
MATGDAPHDSELRTARQPTGPNQNAALQGATMAFGKPPLKPKPTLKPINQNPALAAASKAGRDSTLAGRTISSQNTGTTTDDDAGNTLTRHHTGKGTVGAGLDGGSVRSRLNDSTGDEKRSIQRLAKGNSESHIAANLAASRSVSTSPNRKSMTGQQRTVYRRGGQHHGETDGLMENTNSYLSPMSAETNGNAFIPPTSQLINAFEKIASTPSKTDASPQYQRPLSYSGNDLSSPKPEPSLSNPGPKSPEIRTSLNNPKPKPKPKPKPETLPGRALAGSPCANPPIPESDPAERRLLPPSTSTTKSAGKYTEKHINKDPIIFPSNTEDDEDASSENSFVSASDGLQSDYKPEPAVAKPRHIHPNQQQRPFIASRDPTALSRSSMTVNSLANAMVASALASSRSQSPSGPSKKPAPAPPPTRRSTTSIFANAQAHMSQSSRTPSPSKSSLQKHHTGGKTGMRTTMRKTPRSSDDEDTSMAKRGRKNLMKKHPNKHHEGDRKRWRDAVSDRERKRYEGLWASNKGLFTSPSTIIKSVPGITSPPPRRNSSIVGTKPGASDSLRSPPEDCVSSLVVRDIWSRSRLPDDVLSDIWELVDRGRTGMLSRDEFVAGVWLVDQRLKGRKLPQRVGDSVWVSVGTLGGVKVKDKHAKGAARKAKTGDSRDLR